MVREALRVPLASPQGPHSAVVSQNEPAALSCNFLYARTNRQSGRGMSAMGIERDFISSEGECSGVPKTDSAVLVTGAAGFIGSALCAKLKDRLVQTVVGLDSFTKYYSPALKHARVQELVVGRGAVMVEGDVCNRTLLISLINTHNFTHIVHLAAQAGVRHSLEHPLTYIRENVECFVELLEAIRHTRTRTHVHLTYASSSSVYGLNPWIPFSEAHRVDLPANVYGATKRMNELLAVAYHNLYGIKSVGLRFFTVYGPWGRPDMALWNFVDGTLSGKEICVYNNGAMKRDFTYIDDIVDGVCAAMGYCATDVFNLGNSKPVQLTKLIAIIEKELGSKAIKRFVRSNVEIPETFANVDRAHQLLGFTPKTSIEDGVRKFIEWYHSHRADLL